VIDSNDGLMGVDVAGEGDTESPGSGGASPYLRRGFKFPPDFDRVAFSVARIVD
jgi:hypothetical protein